ncbi:MAG: NADPH:quinone oxidoreductase family protein [Pyrinomonadaceae bacterium]|nr:NADPH:quinone oxidoreductase family protein [Pyrinomonadaceae bacterium]
MKAIRVDAFGGVDVLQLVERSKPEPREGEVLVRVEASGLNYADVMQREGLYPGGPKPPYFSGVEAAGVVESTGAQESALTPVGTRVVCLVPSGAHAEYVLAHERACIPLPDSVSFVEGAAFPVQYLTAYHALTTLAHAAEGETVLIHAAGGGLGTASVQIGRLLGLRVIGTASTQEKRERVLELGADSAVDYEDFEAAAREITGGRGPDIILETIGGDVMRRNLALLPSLGRMVIIGFASKESPGIDSVKLLFRSQAVLGFHLNAILERRELMQASVARLLSWLSAGQLKIQVGHTLPLSEIRQAHQLLANRQNYGKVVLLP